VDWHSSKAVNRGADLSDGDEDVSESIKRQWKYEENRNLTGDKRQNQGGG